MLKFKLNKEDFDKLNDVEKTFYAQSGDGYQLQVDGATDKSKLDEFRQTNVDLLKAAEQFKGVDMEKINSLLAQENKLKDAEFIEKKDFEGLVESRTNTMRSDFESKILTAKTELDLIIKTNASTISKYEIEGAAQKAFATHKINPEAFDSVMAQIKSKFSIDNGQVVAKEGDTIILGSDGNLTVSEFVASQPEIFKIQSNGGGGKGGGNNQPMEKGTSSQDKIRAGLEARM